MMGMMAMMGMMRGSLESVRKINKTANFIVVNVYAQIASRF